MSARRFHFLLIVLFAQFATNPAISLTLAEVNETFADCRSISVPGSDAKTACQTLISAANDSSLVTEYVHSSAYANLCLLSLRSEPLVVDLSACLDGIEISQTNHWAHHAVGRAYYRLDQDDLALEALTSAIDLATSDSSDQIYLYFRGTIYDSLGNWDLARVDLERSRDLNSKDPYVSLSLGGAYRNGGTWDLAEAEYLRGVKVAEESDDAGDRSLIPHLFTDLAWGLLARSREDDAIALVTAALMKHDFEGDALAKLMVVRANARLKLGSFADAQSDIRVALLNEPGSEYGNKLARRIKDAIFARQQRERAETDLTDTTKEIRRVALVLGIGQYEHTKSLPNAQNDASDVAALLSDKGYTVFGYPETNHTRSEIFAALEKFQEEAANSDVALFWYSGHGREFRTSQGVVENYLVPADAVLSKPEDIVRDGVSLDRVFSSVVPAGTLRVVVIDACRNDTFPTIVRGGDGFGSLSQRTGVYAVYSTEAGTIAFDGDATEGNSPFAASFLESAEQANGTDVRNLFATVTAGTLARTNNTQQPTKVDLLDSGELMSLF